MDLAAKPMNDGRYPGSGQERVQDRFHARDERGQSGQGDKINQDGFQPDEQPPGGFVDALDHPLDPALDPVHQPIERPGDDPGRQKDQQPNQKHAVGLSRVQPKCEDLVPVG